MGFIYWPISAVMWAWHWLLSLVMNPDWGITWILSIVLLTWTLKAVMVKPTINQMRSARRMQEVQPKLQEVRNKYANDKAKQAEEMQKVYKEMDFKPAAGCLPMLAQVPMFIGLFHVLRCFDRTVQTGGGFSATSDPMTVEQNRQMANYIFSPEQVQSYVDARILDIPLITNLRMNSEILNEMPDMTRGKAALLIVPLIAIIAVTTHFNARMSLARQERRRAEGKVSQPQGQNAEMMQTQMKFMNKVMLWLAPGMLIISGFIWPVGLLFYMLSNTVWTFVQTRWVQKKMDQEEAEEEERKIAAKRTSAPKPGARKRDHRSKAQRKKDNR